MSGGITFIAWSTCFFQVCTLIYTSPHSFHHHHQDAVVIRDTIADSSTNVVAVHWFDFEQVAHGHGHGQQQQPAAAAAAAAKAPQGAAGGAQGVPDVSLPRQQPARSHDHGSVEMRDGHLRWVGRKERNKGSKDQAGGVHAEQGEGRRRTWPRVRPAYVPRRTHHPPQGALSSANVARASVGSVSVHCATQHQCFDRKCP